jgi:hypothetical protein
VDCVPAIQVPHRRKRRVPEREMLDRLRRYEALLRQNGIEFEPLHPECGLSGEKDSAGFEVGESEDERSRAMETGLTPLTPVDPERFHEAKYAYLRSRIVMVIMTNDIRNVWRHALSHEVRPCLK